MQFVMQLANHFILQQKMPCTYTAYQNKVALTEVTELPSVKVERHKLIAEWTRVDGQLICQWTKKSSNVA